MTGALSYLLFTSFGMSTENSTPGPSSVTLDADAARQLPADTVTVERA